MKTKKTKRANLENFRTIFFQIGTILVLSAILVAFEWKSSVKLEELPDNRGAWIDITELPPILPPKAEIPEVKAPAYDFVRVDNDVKIEDEPLFADTEIEEFEGINIVEFEKPDEIVDDEPVVIAEFMPTFQGKDLNSFRNYIAENINFSERAKESGIVGTVYATFVIDKSGFVTNVQIMRGVHPDVDNAVLKVIKNSPKWEPGMNNGRYVKVQFTIPIVFQLL